ncbi:MAG: 4-hydroxy-tetrahydrodipicolinate reductase, partial [uncultured Thermoleophilia bacterium]
DGRHGGGRRGRDRPGRATGRRRRRRGARPAARGADRPVAAGCRCRSLRPAQRRHRRGATAGARRLHATRSDRGPRRARGRGGRAARHGDDRPDARGAPRPGRRRPRARRAALLRTELRPDRRPHDPLRGRGGRAAAGLRGRRGARRDEARPAVRHRAPHRRRGRGGVRATAADPLAAAAGARGEPVGGLRRRGADAHHPSRHHEPRGLRARGAARHPACPGPSRRADGRPRRAAL